MKLNRPKNTTWWIAVALGVLSLLAKYSVITVLTPYAFWLAFGGFALLALATYFKNL